MGGSAVIFFIVLLYGFSLSAVFSVGSDYALSDFLKDDYLHQVIAFSVGQALLSALLSSIIGMLFARAFFYLDFKGQIAHFYAFFPSPLFCQHYWLFSV